MTENEEAETHRVVQDDIEVIGDPADAVTIFADGAQGFFAANNVAKINLFQIVQDVTAKDATSSLKKVVVARLVMSPQTAHQMATWLLQQIKVEEQSSKDG